MQWAKKLGDMLWPPMDEGVGEPYPATAPESGPACMVCRDTGWAIVKVRCPRDCATPEERGES